MPQFGCKPDVSIHNSILRFPSIDASSAYTLLLNMKHVYHLKPDLVTYVCVIKKLCLENRLTDAISLVKKMEEDGCVPNVVVYSALLDGACRTGDLDKGMEILEEMEREGRVNVVSYTCLMKFLCDSGRVDEALAVLDRMWRNGCWPNRVTLRTLIKGFCVEGRVNDAYKVADKMTSNKNDGRMVSGECYSMLVLCLLRVGEKKKAESLLYRMSEMNVRPDGVVCNTLLREICEQGCYLDGYNWICAFQEKGVNCIDNDVYSCLLEGLCEGGNWVEALRLGRMIVENEVRVEESCIISVLKVVENVGDDNLVSQMLRIREKNKGSVVA